MVTKNELIMKLRSPENKQTLQAIEELRARGWLFDGALKGIALCRSELQGADLMNACLIGVDFHQAHLEYADLSMADLRTAKLTRANLLGANLSHANLTRVDLYKANLRDVRNLEDEQLSKATRLWGATMPDGTTYDGRFNLSGDLAHARWTKVDIDDPETMANFYGVPLEVYLRSQEVENQPAKRACQ